MIDADKIVVFSWSFCPACDNAKKFLTDAGIEAQIIELDDLSDDFHDYGKTQEAMTGQKTVPNIYIAGEHIGTLTHLSNEVKDGKLKVRLDKLGIKHLNNFGPE